MGYATYELLVNKFTKVCVSNSLFQCNDLFNISARVVEFSKTLQNTLTCNTEQKQFQHKKQIRRNCETNKIHVLRITFEL